MGRCDNDDINNVDVSRSLFQEESCNALVATSNVPVLLVSIIRDGSMWEQWLAAGCLSELCNHSNDDLPYQACCAGALNHVLSMLEDP